MTDKADDTAGIDAAWADAGSIAGLEPYLEAHSRLPGPRANLGLAKRFADMAASQGVTNQDWETLRQ